MIWLAGGFVIWFVLSVLAYMSEYARQDRLQNIKDQQRLQQMGENSSAVGKNH